MSAQPLDSYTLRQAAARWPRETLNTRAAQSFLHSLADEAERQQRPARLATCGGTEMSCKDPSHDVHSDFGVAGEQDLTKALRARPGVQA